MIKVSVKENEVSAEKNSSRASIFATKASYISNQSQKTKLPFYFSEFQKALKCFALELGGIEFTAEAPALSRC